MVSGGQIGFGTMFSLSLVLGGLLGVLALSVRRRIPPRERPPGPAPSGPPDRDLVPEPEPVGLSSERLDTLPITSREEDDDLRNDG
jgi:hypothetical protein